MDIQHPSNARAKKIRRMRQVLGIIRSRAEAHGGTLTLENRRDTRGFRAALRLPL